MPGNSVQLRAFLGQHVCQVVAVPVGKSELGPITFATFPNLPRRRVGWHPLQVNFSSRVFVHVAELEDH